MEVRMLGAHNLESRDARVSTLLVDGILALDAGALTSPLTSEEQLGVKAVLVTHHHYDHIKDLVLLCAAHQFENQKLDVYGLPSVYDALRAILQYPGNLYTDFLTRPAGDPTLRFHAIEPLKPLEVAGYDVLPVTVNHSVPAVGYQVRRGTGRSLFYTGDTGPGLDECWKQISPDVVIIECTGSNRFTALGRSTGHLTPALLGEELRAFHKLKGYLPHVVTTHHFPMPQEEADRKVELARLAQELGAAITHGYEGLEIEV
jgi:ribonuclease BN (tRNA processing enzyme)